MKFKIVSTVVLLCIGSMSAHCVAGSAESWGPVAEPAVRFPCSTSIGVTPERPPVTQLQIETSSSKSAGKAFILSLLVPGLGEWYAGSPSRAKFFFAVEVAVWSGFAAFEHHSTWKKRDYKLLAVDRAGIDPEGKDDNFYKQIGQYEDIWEYNEEMRHFRDMDEVYWDEAFYFWEWDSPEALAKYSELRESSRKAHRRALNMVGAAVLNRLISAVDAVRTARTYNKHQEREKTGFSLDLKLNGSLNNPRAMVVLEKKF